MKLRLKSIIIAADENKQITKATRFLAFVFLMKLSFATYFAGFAFGLESSMEAQVGAA